MGRVAGRAEVDRDDEEGGELMNCRVTCAIPRDLRLSGQVVSLGGHHPYPNMTISLYNQVAMDGWKGVTRDECARRAHRAPSIPNPQPPVPKPHPNPEYLSVFVSDNRARLSKSCVHNSLRFDIISVIRRWGARAAARTGAGAAKRSLSPSTFSLRSNPSAVFGQIFKHFETKGVAS